MFDASDFLLFVAPGVEKAVYAGPIVGQLSLSVLVLSKNSVGKHTIYLHLSVSPR